MPRKGVCRLNTMAPHLAGETIPKWRVHFFEVCVRGGVDKREKRGNRVKKEEAALHMLKNGQGKRDSAVWKEKSERERANKMSQRQLRTCRWIWPLDGITIIPPSRLDPRFYTKVTKGEEKETKLDQRMKNKKEMNVYVAFDRTKPLARKYWRKLRGVASVGVEVDGVENQLGVKGSVRPGIQEQTAKLISLPCGRVVEGQIERRRNKKRV